MKRERVTLANDPAGGHPGHPWTSMDIQDIHIENIDVSKMR